VEELRTPARSWHDGQVAPIVFKKVCKVQKFTILVIGKIKTENNELYTRANLRNFQ
jgi:hypothetical protein